MTDLSALPPSRTIVVIGGAGVFGAKVAAGLAAAGFDVVIAGRDLAKAEAKAAELKCRAARLDLAAPDFAGSLAKLSPFAVIDAAGPFQAYADYAVPKAAIAARAHYLDLADDAGFAAGITTLDAAARDAGVVVLSGVSSVPALSSAIAADLVAGLSDVHLVESVILPGNRAPRGLSVVRAIVSQAGKSLRVWRGGTWTTVPGWGWPGQVDLDVAGAKPIRRRWASFIGAPDLALFPAAFRARSVLFRAGLENRLMYGGLVLLGALARLLRYRHLERASPALLWVAERLKNTGTDRGGMLVRVAGLDDEERARTRTWTLIAEEGDGPEIPAIPARIMIGKIARGAVAAGARPCIAEFTCAEAEAALANIRTRCGVKEAHQPILFADTLGARFAALPPQHRDLHKVIDRRNWRGEACVTRGTGWLGRIIGALVGLPPASQSVPVHVSMQREGETELWLRDFGGSRFSSRLSPRGADGRLYERFGPMRFALHLRSVTRGGKPALQYAIERADCLGIPLPSFLRPSSDTFEYVEDGRVWFDVTIALPLGGLIARYHGWLEDAGGDPAQGHAAK